jgi:hypothetical protein
MYMETSGLVGNPLAAKLRDKSDFSDLFDDVFNSTRDIDRAFFQANPARRFGLRRVCPGELGQAGLADAVRRIPGCATYVLVWKPRVGARVRLFFTLVLGNPIQISDEDGAQLYRAFHKKAAGRIDDFKLVITPENLKKHRSPPAVPRRWFVEGAEFYKTADSIRLSKHPRTDKDGWLDLRDDLAAAAASRARQASLSSRGMEANVHA